MFASSGISACLRSTESGARTIETHASRRLRDAAFAHGGHARATPTQSLSPSSQSGVLVLRFKIDGRVAFLPHPSRCPWAAKVARERGSGDGPMRPACIGRFGMIALLALALGLVVDGGSAASAGGPGLESVLRLRGGSSSFRPGAGAAPAAAQDVHGGAQEERAAAAGKARVGCHGA